MPEIVNEQIVDALPATVLAWHRRRAAAWRMVPPWVTPTGLAELGEWNEDESVAVAVNGGEWSFRLREFDETAQRIAIEIAAPGASFGLVREVTAHGDTATGVRDVITPTGNAPASDRLHRIAAALLRRLTIDATLLKMPGDAPHCVAISGATGLIGSHLSALLAAGGHEVRRLVRRANEHDPSEIAWNTDTGEVTTDRMAGVDALVHLAGVNIAAGRWNGKLKAAIRDSRVPATRKLCEHVARLDSPPRVLVCASAVGYYGDRGDKELDEQAAAGDGFLPEVSAAWEAATEPARAAGIRVVNLRLGVVLTPRGGALAQMLTPFRLGIAGRLGSGRQYMSWVGLEDAVGVAQFALGSPAVSGPVNLTAPQPVTNREFTRTLGRVLNRPTILPAPAFALRLALGEMADALLLASTRAVPAAALAAGYRFVENDLEQALRAELGRRS